MLIASIHRPPRGRKIDRALALAAGTTVAAYAGACFAFFGRGAGR